MPQPFYDANRDLPAELKSRGPGTDTYVCVCVCVCVCARESEVPLRLKVQMKTWNKGMSVQDNLMQSRFPSNDIPRIHFGFLCFCRTFLAPGPTDVSHRQLKTSFRRSQTTLPMAKTKPIHQPLHVLYKHLKTGCVICGFFYSFHLFMTEEWRILCAALYNMTSNKERT